MKKVAVVSHDAGGAEILSSWLKMHSYNYLTVIDKPFVNNLYFMILFDSHLQLKSIKVTFLCF